MIDDFTIYNGPTRVIAGSHRFNKYAENNKNYKKEKLILGKKGAYCYLMLLYGMECKKFQIKRDGL